MEKGTCEFCQFAGERECECCGVLSTICLNKKSDQYDLVVGNDYSCELFKED